jgi:hypothetical protein
MKTMMVARHQEGCDVMRKMKATQRTRRRRGKNIQNLQTRNFGASQSRSSSFFRCPFEPVCVLCVCVCVCVCEHARTQTTHRHMPHAGHTSRKNDFDAQSQVHHREPLIECVFTVQKNTYNEVSDTRLDSGDTDSHGNDPFLHEAQCWCSRRWWWRGRWCLARAGEARGE